MSENREGNCQHMWDIACTSSTTSRIERTWRCRHCPAEYKAALDMPERPAMLAGFLSPEMILEVLAGAGAMPAGSVESEYLKLAAVVGELCAQQRLVGAAKVEPGPARASGGAPDLTAVIHWLEGGCDPRLAAHELRAYQRAMGQKPAPELDKTMLSGAQAAVGNCNCSSDDGDELLTNVARSRGKYPANRRLFDALMEQIEMLARAYHGEGDTRGAALDVAANAFRIAVEGDVGGNVHWMLSSSCPGGMASPDLLKIADAARLRLSMRYEDRLRSNSSHMGGNMDWARIEGAVAVVNALRRVLVPQGRAEGVSR